MSHEGERCFAFLLNLGACCDSKIDVEVLSVEYLTEENSRTKRATMAGFPTLPSLRTSAHEQSSSIASLDFLKSRFAVGALDARREGKTAELACEFHLSLRVQDD